MTQIKKEKDRTELVFILDRSGSMSGLESDTIGGFNAMLEKQRALENACRITTVLFDDHYELLHDAADITTVRNMTREHYEVGGLTALLDAVGWTIGRISSRRQEENILSGQVLFVIMTDGMENASREYTVDAIRRLIEYRQADFGWEFLFLGANFDAVETASRYGIRANRAQNWHADASGVRGNFQAISEVIVSLCDSEPVSDDWAESIREDYENRDLC